MQWTSRRGRGVLNAQMGAALLSGVLLTLLNCAVYLGPFLATGALRFWECSLISVWNAEFPWFDWTYGQYLLILLGHTFLLLWQLPDSRWCSPSSAAAMWLCSSRPSP